MGTKQQRDPRSQDEYDYNHEIAQPADQSIPLRDSVYQSLRKAILTGKMKPGERLTEIRLGRMLGTSRTPIREAIRLLETEGLVTIVPGSGARVAAMTEQDLQEVMEVRCVLEQLSVRLASQRINSCYRKELKEACDDFERITLTGNELEIAEADVRFHDIIMEASGNSLLCEIIGNLADNIYRYRYEYIRDEVHYGQIIREHKEICDAILCGDEAGASRIATEHIRNQYDFIRRRLENERQGDRRG